MNIVLLLAGGQGRRAQTDIPKQFLEVKSVPVIVYTMRVFQSVPSIDAICVVSHPDWIETVWSYKGKYSLSKMKWVVSGGRTGLESVKNGINALDDVDDKS